MTGAQSSTATARTKRSATRPGFGLCIVAAPTARRATGEPEYLGHFEIRWLSRSGNIKWRRRQLFVSQALAHEWVGLEEVASRVWSLYFYDRLLARLDERSGLRLRSGCV